MKKSKASHYLLPICNCDKNCGGKLCRKMNSDLMYYANDDEDNLTIQNPYANRIFTQQPQFTPPHADGGPRSGQQQFTQQQPQFTQPPHHADVDPLRGQPQPKFANPAVQQTNLYENVYPNSNLSNNSYVFSPPNNFGTTELGRMNLERANMPLRTNNMNNRVVQTQINHYEDRDSDYSWIG